MLEKLLIIIFAVFSFLLLSKTRRKSEVRKDYPEQRRNTATAIAGSILAFLVFDFLLESIVSIPTTLPSVIDGLFIGVILFLVEKMRDLVNLN